jgi:hypothetical protein
VLKKTNNLLFKKLNELRGGGYALLKRVSAVFAKNQL